MTEVQPPPSAFGWTSLLTGGAVARVSTHGPITAPFDGARLLGRIRAGMVVPVVDGVMMLLPLSWRPHQFYAVTALAILGTALLTGGGRYTAPLHLSVLDDLPSIAARLLSAVGTVSVLVLVTRHKESVLNFLETAWQAIALVIIGRVITTRMIAVARRKGISTRRAVLIGGGPLAGELARILDDHHEYGLQVAGFVDDGEDSPSSPDLPRLGSLAQLDTAVINTGADTLLLADGRFEERESIDAVRTPACRDRDLLVVPRMHHFHTMTGMADHIGSIPVMRIRRPNLAGPARMIKRDFDIAVAATALTLLSPLLFTVALLVRLEGGPGVIFRQVRVGRDGGLFEVLKFRSMRPCNEAESQTQWSVAGDSRVGPVGRLLRRTSVDELPQLWNILRGDMTLVGPRPERPHFVEQFSKQFDRYAERHRVTVGLTGLAQVSGLRGDTSIADRARFDNFYIEHWSLWLDIKIILRTVREVFCYRER